MRFIFRMLLVLSLSVSSSAYADSARDLYRAQIRGWVMSHSIAPMPTIAPAENDQAADLVDNLAVTNLAEMEQRGLLKSTLQEGPWSDYYWPTYAGQIANRYADPHYSAALLWQPNHDYLAKNVGRGEGLSPAEKYDLLVGDADFTLSRRMIDSGTAYVDADGKVPTWFGLCHGWSPASFMLPRPSRAVTAKAADGSEITFTPSDMKALATLLWANGSGPTKFVGGRCNDKDVGRDDNNRETNPDCFDTNPATWHLAIVNQIGVSHRSFVMDASAGYEVWNQPLYAYSYGYVNPITRKSGYDLAKAKVAIADFRTDPFAAHRSPNAKYLVNVVMSVTYVAETAPSTDLADEAANDAHLAVTYSYDLELDDHDAIVGGEWHSSIHPDFLWVPVKGSSATSVGDAWLTRRNDHSKWNPRAVVPSAWQKAAKQSAGAEQPLARIVEGLFQAAQP